LPAAGSPQEEALNLFLEEPTGSKIVFPLPDDSLDGEKDIIKILEAFPKTEVLGKPLIYLNKSKMDFA
jgi:hypothetical protein